MPGSSYIERPGSPSARFQGYLRRKFVKKGAIKNISIIDLARRLRESYQNDPGKWYYPNEGHLTPEGHRVVADILASTLN